MSKQIFDFNKQMVVGDSGENDFVRFYQDLEPRKSEDRRIDFFLKDGASVELKTDTYDMRSTENFFMEASVTYIKHVALGGPWRALQDNVDFFVYYFPRNKTFFWFKTIELCKLLDDIILLNKMKTRSVRNKGWCGEGFAISRAALDSVLFKKDEFND